MALCSLRPTAVLLSTLVFVSSVFAQAPRVDFPAPSPTATLKQRVGLTDIEITYSRPGLKGREIFGALQSYGKVWRTGANSPTRVTFSTPVKFQGVTLEAGAYELSSIPGKEEWLIIVQKAGAQSDGTGYKPANDLARIPVRSIALKDPVETFTVDINDIRDESATLNLVWEKTRVSVKLEFDVMSVVMGQIAAALASPEKKSANFYYGAAQFYHTHDIDHQKALEWITLATDHPKPAFFMVHLKAKILAKLGNNAGAKATAAQSTELAIAAEGAESPFVKLNRDLVAGLR